MAVVKDYLDPNAAAYVDLNDLDPTAASKLSAAASIISVVISKR